MSRLNSCAVGLWRIGLFALLCCWHIRSLAQFDPKEWPQVTLRFTEGGTLKDVFDAGLRPYRFPTLERSLLEVKHARVTILQRNGQPLLEFPAELVQIHPLQGGLLSSVEMTRYKTTLDESRVLILPYLPKGGRNAQELEHFLAAVKADYLDYNGMGTGLDNYAVRWNEEGGPRYVVAFRKAFDPVRPLILFLSIDWSQARTRREMRSFYKEPIPPLLVTNMSQCRHHRNLVLIAKPIFSCRKEKQSLGTDRHPLRRHRFPIHHLHRPGFRELGLYRHCQPHLVPHRSHCARCLCGLGLSELLHCLP
jgi:hypothetical protein